MSPSSSRSSSPSSTSSTPTSTSPKRPLSIDEILAEEIQEVPLPISSQLLPLPTPLPEEPKPDVTEPQIQCSHIAEAWNVGGTREKMIGRFRELVGRGTQLKKGYESASSSDGKRRKVQAPTCGTCQKTLHRPFVCMECSFAGCWRGDHGVGHLKEAGHPFCVDVTSGAIFCKECDDFVHNSTLERLVESISLSREEIGTPFQDSNKKRDAFTPWSPSEKESELLKNGTSPVVCQARRGLLNLGSSCYLNVILQTLIHNPLLRNYFMSDRHNSNLCGRKDCICCEMDRLFTEVYSPSSAPLAPTQILNSLWASSSELSGYAQQDAHEALISLLNLLHTHSRGSTSISCVCIIHQTFAGQLQSDLTCGRCKSVKSVVDPMLDVSLELKGREGVVEEMSLVGCLKRFTRPEKLGPNEQVFCTECKADSKDATKRLSIRKLPPVLCFQFKRFSHTSTTTATKIDTPVLFPSRLNMAPYTAAALGMKPLPKGADKEKEMMMGPDSLYEYELFAVVNHEGAMNTGHYTNFARFGDEWYRFDDEKVTPSTLRDCLNSRAYMCVYVKRHLEYVPYQRPSYVLKSQLLEEERIRKEKKGGSGGVEVL